MPDRISIQGISGSGKTTLGRELGRRLGIPHLETDALVHGPNWSEASDAALRAHLIEFTAADRWVVDSDYRRKVGTLVLERADTVVWLDLPLHTCLRRLWHRTERPDSRLRAVVERQRGVAGGPRWSAGTRCSSMPARTLVATRRTLPAMLGQPHLSHLRVVRLRSPEQVESWLSSVEP